MTHNFKTHFQMFAAYNAWANQKIFAVLSGLSDAQLKQRIQAFFPSLLHLANHLLVGDLLWFERISPQGNPQYALDTILYDELNQLQDARIQQDIRLQQFIAVQTVQSLQSNISYIRQGQCYEEPLSEILAHLFNHQTHHRGQMQSAIYAQTHISLELDLIIFQRKYAHLYRQ